MSIVIVVVGLRSLCAMRFGHVCRGFWCGQVRLSGFMMIMKVAQICLKVGQFMCFVS